MAKIQLFLQKKYVRDAKTNKTMCKIKKTLLSGPFLIYFYTFAFRKKAFFSIMQNKTDMGTSLVSKSLPVANSNSVNRSFSA